MLYRIKNIEIDTLNFQLSIDGKSVAVEPQTLDLIVYLIGHRNKALTRQKIFDHIWAGKVVSDCSLSTLIKKARKVLGDDGKHQLFIKTIHGRGVQFIAEVEELSSPNGSINNQLEKVDAQTSDASSLSVTSYAKPLPKPLELPDKPSLAVMDFVDIGANEEGTLFAYGLATDINSALSRFTGLFVTARASASIVSNLKLTPKEVARRLGVHYLVFGQTQYQANRVKVTLSVVDAINDNEIWSEHFDRSFDDLFQVQSDIANTIVVAIDFAIEQTEIERTFLIPTKDLSAWENYHRGILHLNKTTVKDQEKTQYYLHKAIELDPKFSRAYAGLSDFHMSAKMFDMSTGKSDDAERAYDYAMRSIDYCKFESMGYMSLGRTSFYSNEPEQALTYLNHGLQLNPNYSRCHALKGGVFAHTGCANQALHHLEVAERLSPFDALLFAIKMGQVIALIRQKKFEEAVQISLLASSYPNAYFLTHAETAASLQLAGNTNEARQYVNKALQMNPGFSVEIYLRFLPFSEPSTRRLMSDAMHVAGMPMSH